MPCSHFALEQYAHARVIAGGKTWRDWAEKRGSHGRNEAGGQMVTMCVWEAGQFPCPVNCSLHRYRLRKLILRSGYMASLPCPGLY